MTTIAEKLALIDATKENLYTAIQSKGVAMDGVPFDEYPSKVYQIQSGGVYNSLLSDTFLMGYWDNDSYQRLLNSIQYADGLIIDYPNIANFEQRVEGTFVVSQGTVNRLALTITSSTEVIDPFGEPAPAFSIDWGDGTSVMIYSGTTIVKEYDYQALAAGGGGNDSIEVRFTAVPMPNAVMDLVSFQADPYPNPGWKYTSGLKKLAVNAPNLTTLIISPSQAEGMYAMTRLEEVYVGTNSLLSFQNMFSGCINLKKVVNLYTANCEIFDGMFQNCQSLVTVPPFDDSKGISFGSMFTECYNLITVPPMSMVKMENAYGAFSFSGVIAMPDCPTMSTGIPPGSYAYLTYMFQGCTRLKRVPVYNLDLVMTISGMFMECLTLEVCDYNLHFPVGENCSEAFSGCSNLKGGLTISGPNLKQLNSVAAWCSCLSFASLNIPVSEGVYDLFNGCFSLKRVHIEAISALSWPADRAFLDCSLLTNVTAGAAGIPLNQVPLFGPIRKADIETLINTMPNYVPNPLGNNTIDFGGVFNIALTQDNIDTITAKGYTYVLP